MHLSTETRKKIARRYLDRNTGTAAPKPARSSYPEARSQLSQRMANRAQTTKPKRITEDSVFWQPGRMGNHKGNPLPVSPLVKGFLKPKKPRT